MLSKRDIIIATRSLKGDTATHLASQFGMSRQNVCLIVNRYCRAKDRALHGGLLERSKTFVGIKVLRQYANIFLGAKWRRKLEVCADTPIEAFKELSTRAINCLHAERVFVASDLPKVFPALKVCTHSCLGIPDCGEKTKTEIQAVFRRYSINPRFKEAYERKAQKGEYNRYSPWKERIRLDSPEERFLRRQFRREGQLLETLAT